MKVSLLTTGIWLLLLVLFTNCSHTQAYRVKNSAEQPSTAVVSRLILVGDAGHAHPESNVLAVAAARARQQPEDTDVILLGDNIYPAGLPPKEDETRAEAEGFINAQIDAFAPSGATVTFVPGNHDWDDSGEHGQQRLKLQQDYVGAHPSGHVRMLPKEGLPGPVCETRKALDLVFLDTQWWIHQYKKPAANESQSLKQLSQCIASAKHPVVVVSHHPVRTYGVHGGFFTWQDHLFPLTRLSPMLYVPLPIIGSMYPWYRTAYPSIQDLASEENQAVIDRLKGTMKTHRPLIWAAGHEHNLQAHRLAQGPQFALVSGAGSKQGAVTHGPDTLFAQQALGFMEVEFFADNSVLLTVYSDLDGKVSKRFRHWLVEKPVQSASP